MGGRGYEISFKNLVESILGRSALILVDLLPYISDFVIASPDELFKLIFQNHITDNPHTTYKKKL
jgi:hypothetical protein